MLFGKIRHAVGSRLFGRRAALASPPTGFDWVSAFDNPQLRLFAKTFSVYGARFGETCHGLHSGEFVSNEVSYSFGSPSAVRWGSALNSPEFARWQHDLAFFFFAIPLISNEPEQGTSTIASMIRALEKQLKDDQSDFLKFHWLPIAVANRTLALATALALLPREVALRNSDSIAVIGQHVWRSAEILKWMVERYVGFNHGATTEAGLAIALMVQGKSREARGSFDRLIRTLEDGTLEDGMWAERSPTYHLHMLVLVDALMSMFKGDSSDYHNRLSSLSHLMHLALAGVVHPDGEIAVFNDAGTVDAPAPSAVGWTPTGTPPTLILPAGGYARIERSNTVVVMDAGPMGPDEVIAHGHADFLSVEISIGANRLIVDPGVASLSAGPDRAWTRSADSHNGPTLEGREPAEFFGTFRVGRRGTAYFEGFSTTTSGAVSVVGVCDGYKPWNVLVKRRILVELDGRLTIEDQWLSSRGISGASVAFLLDEEWEVMPQTESELKLCHRDGSTVSLRLHLGTFGKIEDSRSFREGGMRPRGATRIVIVPDDWRVSTVIDPRGSAACGSVRASGQ